MPSDLSQLTDSNFVWTILPLTGSTTHKILLSSAAAPSASATPSTTSPDASAPAGLDKDLAHLTISSS
jgi:hypothetical protein